MSQAPAGPGASVTRFRLVLVRVLAAELVAWGLLWLLQARYSS